MKSSRRRPPVDFGASVTEALGEQASEAVSPPAEAVVSPARPEFQPEPSFKAAAQDAATPSGWPIYLTALAASILWALGPIAFALGYQNSVAPLQENSFAIAVFALLGLAPAALIWGAAYLIRQGQKLAAETRRTKAMADDMLSPALVAAARAGQVAQGVRDEIVRVSAAAEAARETLSAVRALLAAQAEQLTADAAQSVRTADDLATTLGRQHAEMGQLAVTLDGQATKVAASITQQTHMVTEASDLAGAQLREAEAALAARAADLAAAAAGEAAEATRTAGEGLAQHISRLETNGAGLSEQRTALTSLAQTLKSDHEAFSGEAQTHAARLGDFIAQARQSAAEMGERADQQAQALRLLIAEAASQATAAREQVDQLSETAFTAGQKANQAFEARLEEAKALVGHSSQMVEETGAATARKLEAGAASARATLDELAAMMGEIEQRTAGMPAAARGQSDQVRAIVAEGMEALMAQARRTAQEAQAIDAAFQERVRRNFEMLGEAVRLMGAVTAAAPGPAPLPPASGPLELDVLAAGVSATEQSDGLGLGRRLKLTPTATDAEFSAVFAAAGGRPDALADDETPEDTPAEADAWTWKDLLASLDSADGEGERLEDKLSAELDRMGVDPGKLLPKSRTTEIAAVVQAGDLSGARAVVKRLAPAATRRIARRLFTDEEVKRQTALYVRRYQTLVDDAVVRDPKGLLMAELLNGGAGRLYLLLDAAAGDTA